MEKLSPTARENLTLVHIDPDLAAKENTMTLTRENLHHYFNHILRRIYEHGRNDRAQQLDGTTNLEVSLRAYLHHDELLVFMELFDLALMAHERQPKDKDKCTITLTYHRRWWHLIGTVYASGYMGYPWPVENNVPDSMYFSYLDTDYRRLLEAMRVQI